jgi:hypothetical protein
VHKALKELLVVHEGLILDVDLKGLLEGAHIKESRSRNVPEGSPSIEIVGSLLGVKVLQ